MPCTTARSSGIITSLVTIWWSAYRDVLRAGYRHRVAYLCEKPRCDCDDHSVFYALVAFGHNKTSVWRDLDPSDVPEEEDDEGDEGDEGDCNDDDGGDDDDDEFAMPSRSNTCSSLHDS